MTNKPETPKDTLTENQYISRYFYIDARHLALARRQEYICGSTLILLRERVPGRLETPKAQHARKRSGKRTVAAVDSGERSQCDPPKGTGASLMAWPLSQVTGQRGDG